MSSLAVNLLTARKHFLFSILSTQQFDLFGLLTGDHTVLVGDSVRHVLGTKVSERGSKFCTFSNSVLFCSELPIVQLLFEGGEELQHQVSFPLLKLRVLDKVENI